MIVTFSHFCKQGVNCATGCLLQWEWLGYQSGSFPCENTLTDDILGECGTNLINPSVPHYSDWSQVNNVVERFRNCADVKIIGDPASSPNLPSQSPGAPIPIPTPSPAAVPSPIPSPAVNPPSSPCNTDQWKCEYQCPRAFHGTGLPLIHPGFTPTGDLCSQYALGSGLAFLQNCFRCVEKAGDNNAQKCALCISSTASNPILTPGECK